MIPSVSELTPEQKLARIANIILKMRADALDDVRTHHRRRQYGLHSREWILARYDTLTELHRTLYETGLIDN